MKRLLATTLLLLGGLPAQAKGVHEWYDANKAAPSRRQMVRLLTEHGISVSYRNGCGRNGTSLAHYRPGSNQLCVPSSEREFDSALSHEAVHVLQDCISPGGISDGQMVTIHSYLKRIKDHKLALDFKNGVHKSLRAFNDVPHIQKFYASHLRDMEAEAYALEHNPRFVYGVLKTCLTENN